MSAADAYRQALSELEGRQEVALKTAVEALSDGANEVAAASLEILANDLREVEA